MNPILLEDLDCLFTKDSIEYCEARLEELAGEIHRAAKAGNQTLVQEKMESYFEIEAELNRIKSELSITLL